MRSLFQPGTHNYVAAWLSVACLVTFFTATNISYASTKTNTAVSQQASDSLRTEQLRALVASALARTAQLRDLAHHGKTDHLREQLNQLSALVNLIKAVRPTGEIDALVVYYQQHLDFEDNTQVLADILPLYTALNALPKTKKIEAAHQQLDIVRAALQDGKRAAALSALEDMRRTLSIDNVDFPLQAAEEKLQTITSQYKKNNTLQQSQELLGLESDFLKILNAL